MQPILVSKTGTTSWVIFIVGAVFVNHEYIFVKDF